MQIHIQLIPISSPEQIPTGPDPPEHVYHYTTGLKLRSIINSGAIKPTTAKIEAHEKPVAWFSTQDQWEPTASKSPIPGMQGQIETAKVAGSRSPSGKKSARAKKPTIARVFHVIPAKEEKRAKGLEPSTSSLGS